MMMWVWVVEGRAVGYIAKSSTKNRFFGKTENKTDIFAASLSSSVL